MLGYHSALTKPRPAAPLMSASLGTSLAFAYDIRHGLPSEYDQCDVFYTDLPWRDGFQTFEKRAGITGPRTYADFLFEVSAIIQKLTAPVVLVVGKLALSSLPSPTAIYETRLNGARAVAAVYRTQLTDAVDSTRILAELTERYACIGDFCCGYGRTAKTFYEAGKRFVASDYNPACIGFMAQDWLGWRQPCSDSAPAAR